MSKWLEIPKLIFVNLVVSMREFAEYCRVVWRYYRNPEFRHADLALLKSYLMKSPYKVHKEFMQQRGEEDVYVYGETHLTSMEKLSDLAKIQPDDTYVELGCGRARTCFWMRAFKGCKVVGVDYVPKFIEIANQVVDSQGVEDMDFQCLDYVQNGLPKGTVYYIDATLSNNEEIATLIKEFDKVDKGVKVLAVNMTLTGNFAAERPQWKEKGKAEVSFPWGKADACLFVKM